MTNTRSIAGRKAKKDGHNFEHSVSLLLQEKFNIDVEVDGKPGTKVDLRGGDNRYSVKKTPDDLQVGLITQQNFIDAMDIKDNEIITFIGEFFGGDHLTNYSRRRKNLDEIPKKLSQKFLNFLNNNKENIFKIAITHGSLDQQDSVNYILFPEIKHNASTLKMIDANKMIKDFVQNGNWIYSPNKTSLHFYYNNIRVMGLQMYGSRNKKHKENKTYPNTYFGLQFRIICGKIKANYVTDV